MSQLLHAAASVLLEASGGEPAGTPWRQAPHAALYAIAEARRNLDHAERIAQAGADQQVCRADPQVPIGQRYPTRAEIQTAPPGIEWTFPAVGGGHLTVRNDPASVWWSFMASSDQDPHPPACQHDLDPFRSIPRDIEHAFTHGWNRHRDDERTQQPPGQPVLPGQQVHCGHCGEPLEGPRGSHRCSAPITYVTRTCPRCGETSTVRSVPPGQVGGPPHVAHRCPDRHPLGPESTQAARDEYDRQVARREMQGPTRSTGGG